MLIYVTLIIRLINCTPLSVQVKDVEASIQETVLDQVEEVLTSKAATASGMQSGNPLAAGLEAAKSLCSMLSVLPDPALSAQASLGQAVGAISAKRRLKGDKVAKGLQFIIASDDKGAAFLL